MKKTCIFLITFALVGLAGCDKGTEIGKSISSDVQKTVTSEVDKALKTEAGDTGEGEFTLTNDTIKKGDQTISFKANNVNEDAVTFIYVANQLVFDKKIKNGETYALDIGQIEDAYHTKYQPKVQFYQFTNDSEKEGKITLFKELRYSVK